MRIGFKTKGREVGDALDSHANWAGASDIPDEHLGALKRAVQAAFAALHIDKGGLHDEVFTVAAKLDRNRLELSIDPKGKVQALDAKRVDGDGSIPRAGGTDQVPVGPDFTGVAAEDLDVAQHALKAEPPAEEPWPRDLELPGTVLGNDALRAAGKDPADSPVAKKAARAAERDAERRVKAQTRPRRSAKQRAKAAKKSRAAATPAKPKGKVSKAQVDRGRVDRVVKVSDQPGAPVVKVGEEMSPEARAQSKANAGKTTKKGAKK